ncbi:MAG: hypothetical protein M3021_09415 [Actinomycetota bacterium]|nr:hypothetical protein [Actinomycetota bacterium]
MAEPEDTNTGMPLPVSDNDTYAVIDDALTALAGRRGRNLGDDLEVIGLIASLIDQAECFLPQLVTDALANGATWHQIAHLLGTSPDAARLRYSPDSPIADGRWPYNY